MKPKDDRDGGEGKGENQKGKWGRMLLLRLAHYVSRIGLSWAINMCGPLHYTTSGKSRMRSTKKLDWNKQRMHFVFCPPFLHFAYSCCIIRVLGLYAVVAK